MKYLFSFETRYIEISKKLLFTALITFISLMTYGQAFDKEQWSIYSENNKTETFLDVIHNDKQALKLNSKEQAIAWLKNIDYKNFRLEMDIAGAEMSGIGFHVKDEQNYQFIYFRPGYGGTEEAIQYIPIYNGALSWVFYNAPTYEKTAAIERMEWFHVVVEVRNNRLKVFVNHSEEAQMDITLLETDTQSGSILLRSMFGDSYFANFNITEIPSPITDWQISEQFERGETLVYEDLKKVTSWKKTKPSAGEFINLSSYFEHPRGVVFTKTNITSEQNKQAILIFDFVGKLRIFLNEEEVFHYAKHKLDRLQNDKMAQLIKLKKGVNELIFISEGDADIFGDGFNSMGRKQHQNWGFVVHLVDN